MAQPLGSRCISADCAAIRTPAKAAGPGDLGAVVSGRLPHRRNLETSPAARANGVDLKVARARPAAI